jgi:drug/metabolite transporter (DMT)-like permease
VRPDRCQILRGILLSLAATCIFSCNDALATWLTQYHPVPQLVWARFSFQFLLMLALFRPSRPLALLRTQRPVLQVVRSLLLLGSSLLFFMAIRYIPLADAAAIGQASPLIATLLAVVFLGERIGVRRIVAILVGFLGVLLILRPGVGVMHPAALFALGVAVAYAAFQIVTRKLGATEAPMNTLFWSAVVGTAVMSAVVPLFWSEASLAHWAMMAVMGIIGGGGHYLVIRAFRLAPVGVLAPFSYFQLIVSAIMGYVVFDQFPDAWTILGAGVLTLSGLYVLYRETVRRRERREQEA